MIGRQSDLNLTRLYAIHAGEQTFDLAKDIRAVACNQLLDEIPAIG